MKNMRKDKQFRTRYLPLGALVMILIALTACSNPATSTASTYVVPVIAFSTPVQSRVLTASAMNVTDVTAALFSPALTGFASMSVNSGSSLAQSYLGTTISFAISTFSNGTHGITSGTLYSGTLADGSGSISVEVSTDNKSFYYEQITIVDDSIGLLASPGFAGTPNYVSLYTTLTGSIDANLTVLATGKLCVYMNRNGTHIIQATDKYEVYLGKFASSSTAAGIGVCLTALKTLTSMPAGEPASISNATMSACKTYITDYLASSAFTGATGSTGVTLVSKPDSSTTAIMVYPADAAAGITAMTTTSSLWATTSTLLK